MDTGWPMLVAALALIGSIVMVPALDDLGQARLRRDRALAVARYKEEQLILHERFLAALDSGDPHLAEALAATQLNLAPAGQVALIPASMFLAGNPSAFPALSAPPPDLPERQRAGSLLERLVLGERPRRITICVAAMLLLVGLLPPTRPKP